MSCIQYKKTWPEKLEECRQKWQAAGGTPGGHVEEAIGSAEWKFRTTAFESPESFIRVRSFQIFIFIKI